MKHLLVVSFLAVFSLSSASADTKVGFSEVDFDLPGGVPLAGFGGGKRRLTIPDIFNLKKYAFWLKPNEGMLDPVRSKAMAIEIDGKRVVIVSVDLVGVPLMMREKVLSMVAASGLTDADFIMTATHTHSGPGTLVKNLLWETIAVDRFHNRIYNHVSAKVAQSIELALQNMQTANLEHTSFQAENLQGNRSGHPGVFDPTVHILAAKTPSGDTLGAMVNFGVHATYYGQNSLKLSADVAGAVERGLASALRERAGASNPKVLFVNGAEGDVSPSRPATLDEYGALFAEQAMNNWNRLLPVSGPLATTTQEVRAGSPSVNVRGCVGQSLLRRIFAYFRPSLGGIMPRNTKVSAWSIGDLVMATFPGEPTTTVGYSVKQNAIASGFREAMLIGLGQDHLGYFTTPQEYREKSYEACSSMYGPQGAERMVENVNTVVQALRSR